MGVPFAINAEPNGVEGERVYHSGVFLRIRSNSLVVPHSIKYHGTHPLISKRE